MSVSAPRLPKHCAICLRELKKKDDFLLIDNDPSTAHCSMICYVTRFIGLIKKQCSDCSSSHYYHPKIHSQVVCTTRDRRAYNHLNLEHLLEEIPLRLHLGPSLFPLTIPPQEDSLIVMNNSFPYCEWCGDIIYDKDDPQVSEHIFSNPTRLGYYCCLQCHDAEFPQD